MCERDFRKPEGEGNEEEEARGAGQRGGGNRAERERGNARGGCE